MKGFGIVIPHEKAGWFDKEVNYEENLGPFDAICHSVMASACTSDVHQVFHTYLPAGLILGHEVISRVEKVGSMVKRFKPGDIITCTAVNPNWRSLDIEDNIPQHSDGPLGGMNWSSTDGTFAEHYVIRDVDMNATFIPEGITMEQALMCNDMVTTGFHAAESIDFKFGDLVVVCGIGPVGLMALAGTALRGAGTIIAVGRRQITFDLAKHYGANYCINYQDGPIDKQVLELTGGKMPDACIVAGGEMESFAQCVNMVKPNGSVFNLVGQALPTNFDVMTTIQWCVHKKISGGLCPGGARRLERLFNMIKAGRLDPTPLITHRFTGLEAIEDAFNVMCEPKNDDVCKSIIYTE